MHRDTRPAHLCENGGLIGRLVLLLLLGRSFLHLFPVSLLFPVSSLWLQVQSTGVPSVQSGQRQLSEKDPGLDDSPQGLHAPCLSPGPRGQESRQDLRMGQHLPYLRGIKHSVIFLEPFPFLTPGHSQPATGSCHSAAQGEMLANNLYQRPVAHGQNPWEHSQLQCIPWVTGGQ